MTVTASRISLPHIYHDSRGRKQLFEASVVEAIELISNSTISTNQPYRLFKIISLLILRKEVLNCFDLVFESLLLVRSRADADVTLYPHHAVRVDQGVALAD